MSQSDLPLEHSAQQILRSPEHVSRNPKTCFDSIVQLFDRWADENHMDQRFFSEHLAQQYVVASQMFWRGNAVEAALSLLIHGWEKFADLQQKNGFQVSRATILNELTAIHLYILRDFGAATYWALHTCADEFLCSNSEGEGRNNLQTRLGISDEIIDALSRVAESNRNKAQDDWTIKEGFAEEIVRVFIITHPEYHSNLGKSSSRDEFPLCRPFYRILLNDVETAESEGNDHSSKKKSLENLASYLFLLIPCCFPELNINAQDKAFEFDVLVHNANPNGNLIAETFGRYFLGECKNWASKVGAPEVGYFFDRMKTVRANFGVLFTREGITGVEGTAAQSVIRRHFQQENIICVVLSDEELHELGNNGTTFRSLLFKLSKQLRFGS